MGFGQLLAAGFAARAGDARRRVKVLCFGQGKLRCGGPVLRTVQIRVRQATHEAVTR